MKPKQNSALTEKDLCQTPPYAVEPLIPFIPKGVVLEPAAGQGYIVNALQDRYPVVYGDITTGEDFYTWDYGGFFGSIITNPSYSGKHKQRFLARCYELAKPFALLVPTEFISTKGCQDIIKDKPFEIMLLSDRVDFNMPKKGWRSSAQFPTLWLCSRLLPEKIMIGDISQSKKAFTEMLKANDYVF